MQSHKVSSRRQHGSGSSSGRKSSASSTSSKSRSNLDADMTTADHESMNAPMSGGTIEMCQDLSNEVDCLASGTINNSATPCGYQAKPKCRTGWPQHVWALELKNYDQ